MGMDVARTAMLLTHQLKNTQTDLASALEINRELRLSNNLK